MLSNSVPSLASWRATYRQFPVPVKYNITRFFFSPQDVSVSSPDDATAALATANPILFNAERLLIFSFISMLYSVFIYSRCKVTKNSRNSIYTFFGIIFQFPPKKGFKGKGIDLWEEADAFTM